jgi:hypothetical protein
LLQLVAKIKENLIISSLFLSSLKITFPIESFDGKGAKNCFASYLARIHFSFSSLLIENIKRLKSIKTHEEKLNYLIVLLFGFVFPFKFPS